MLGVVGNVARNIAALGGRSVLIGSGRAGTGTDANPRAGQGAMIDAETKVQILEELGMETRTFSVPLEEMSRGMQQKITIARALMVNPPLLLLDEPTTGLDPKSRRDVQAFLEELRRREGTTILLTTHDMGEAERLCARIGFLAHGKLVAEGTAEVLKSESSVATMDEAFIKLASEKLVDDETPEEVLEEV
jgi:ABC-2 type transport system ATP-binding protein